MNFPHGGDSLHETIFQAWRCVVGSGPVVYLSGPITTGRRYVEAIARGLSLDRILAENLTDLSVAAAELRVCTGKLIIDPSPLAIAHWSQDEYMLLWKGLIERYVLEVRFMPDWQYSLGSTMEFVHASQLNIPVLTLDGSPISLSMGREYMCAALAILDNISERHTRIDELSDGLRAQLSQISA